jgi:hypothetical protein
LLVKKISVDSFAPQLKIVNEKIFDLLCQEEENLALSRACTGQRLIPVSCFCPFGRITGTRT